VNFELSTQAPSLHEGETRRRGIFFGKVVITAEKFSFPYRGAGCVVVPAGWLG
jgi:hypothetical protein